MQELEFKCQDGLNIVQPTLSLLSEKSNNCPSFVRKSMQFSNEVAKCMIFRHYSIVLLTMSDNDSLPTK